MTANTCPSTSSWSNASRDPYHRAPLLLMDIRAALIIDASAQPWAADNSGREGSRFLSAALMLGAH